MEGVVCSDNILLQNLFCSVMEAVVVETAIAASKSLLCSLLMMGSLSDGSDVLAEESGTTQGFVALFIFPDCSPVLLVRVSYLFDLLCRFPIGELFAMKRPDSENKDASETEDDEEEDNDDAADDQDEEEDNENDGSGDDGEENGEPKDEPAANGDGASDDEDEEEDDDEDEEEDEEDDDEEEEEEEEEEEDEDEDEEIPQPPTKKRK
ncbi:hypothetical protein Tsubulata_016248 [Turnera subulata]|uniref:Uncharacterized protein n=1 Tax=Turnera subulata TaxID=218843 RepID=A0A9Q0GJJ4_9ROSI|nr:hypothetical protein Tsubulata_016248 [Turnera subulata]